MMRLHGPVLAIVCITSFMGSLDVSAVLIAIPSISSYYAVTPSVSTWVIMSYGLTMASFMLLFGKLGDRLGYRSIVLTGLVLFTSSSLLCGVAGNIIELIIYRGVQGAGAAMLTALGPALISTYLPSARRGQGLGYVATFASIGLATGPVIGGLLIGFLDWRWIFWMNVPLGAGALILAFLTLPHQSNVRRQPFDLTGGLLVFLSLLAVIFCLGMGEELGWGSSAIILSGTTGAMFGLLFLRHVRRVESPLLDLDLLRNSSIRWANCSSMIVLATVAGIFVLIPFYFRYILGWSPESIGLAMLIPTAAMIISGPVAGYLSDRLGCRAISLAACVVLGSGFLLLSLLDTTSPFLSVAVSLFAFGFSIDLFLTPNHSMVMGHTAIGSRGSSSALMMTMQDTGELVGVVFFEMVFSQFVLMGTIDSLDLMSSSEIMPGFQAVFILAVGMSVVAMAMTLMTRDPPRMGSGEKLQVAVERSAQQ